MRNKVRNIASNTGRFQDGNPATGELGTVVTAQWLNEMQDFAQDTFEELKNVLALGNLTPNAAKKNQVAEAISIAIRNVRAVADSNTRSLQNVIPNSKKSNSVASTSSDTVATSYAVKQAYDLARGKQSPATTLAGYGITDAVKLQDLRSYVIDNTPFDDATPAQLPRGTFLGLSSRAALTSQPANGWKLVSKGWHNESGKYACVRLGIVGNKFYYQTAESWNHWGTPIELATANDYVKKSGDTMSGAITFNGLNQLFMKTENRWNWHYAIKLNQDSVIGNDRGGIAFNTSGDIHFFNRQNSSVLGGIGMNGIAWFKGDVTLGNGKKLNDTHQITQPYVSTTIHNDNDGGANFRRRGSEGDWDSRIEPLVDKRWKFRVQNSHDIYLPAKGGTVLLDNDFTYQKTGGFEIRKYPDGTMIQTFIYEQNDIYPERGEQTFAWAVAFIERPLMIGQITSSYNDDHDVGINILSKSTNARVYYYFYEHGHPNQGLCRVQFVGIGRWE